jgi:hypothetical protein
LGAFFDVELGVRVRETKEINEAPQHLMAPAQKLQESMDDRNFSVSDGMGGDTGDRVGGNDGNNYGRDEEATIGIGSNTIVVTF